MPRRTLRLAPLILGLSLLSACSQGGSEPEPDGGNLIRNGDFELWAGPLPEGWHLEQGSESYISKQRGDDGLQAVFGGDKRELVLIASDLTRVSAGAPYTFSLEYYQGSGDGFTTGSYLEVRWLDQAENIIGRSILEGTAVGRWSTLEHTVSAPEGAIFASVAVGRAPIPSVVAIDNVALYERR